MSDQPKEMTDSWERVVDDLIAYNRDDLPTISRQQFIQHFLMPMIEANNARLNDNWMTVAGNVLRHIRVLDNDGSVLGELPSLVSTVETQLVEDEHNTMQSLMEEQRKQAAFSPRAGQLFLEESFRGRNFHSTKLLSSMLTWNDIARKCDAEIPFKQIDEAFRNALPEARHDSKQVQRSDLGLSEDDDELL